MSEQLESLVEQIGINRKSLHTMLGDLVEFRSKLEKLLPKNADHRSKYILEERMKHITNVIDTELRIRKQIDDSLKTEITIRRKSDEDETMKDTRELVEALAEGIHSGKIKLEE